MEKFTYENYFSMLQNTEEGRTAIGATIKYDSANRYASRLALNSSINPEDRLVLQNMSQSEYENLRRYQMTQLYNAYVNKERGGYQMQMDVRNSGDTSIESVRRVTGDKPGYIYNTGILALTQDDITIISNIVQTKFRQRSDDGYYRNESISSLGLETMVNEISAIQSISLNNLNAEYGEISVSKICQGTDALKRIMGMYAGRNVYGIDDFEQCAKLQRRGLISKAIDKLGRSIEKALHPEAKKFDENRFGNQEISIKTEDERG